MTVPPARKPEVMSPAGHWPQLEAAIEAGADAVYFGLRHFTARAKVGFEPEELPEVMRRLHRRGVRGFVTFNTLVFDTELRAAADAIALIAEAGADALIVQDLGALELARRIAPELELHASTQMSITDARGARLAARLGAHRVTLARELSLKEIAAIAAEAEVELEVFVHGALCVAYSGQCFSSEAWGGRSANRGQCAQACRLPYDLWVDGERHPTGDARYLLSPGDLYGLEQVPELVRIGVATLKIEGRYKEADYVAATTRAYRAAVDAAWAGQPAPVPEATRLELEQVYSRGLGPWFLTGTDHQAVVVGRAPRHRGVRMGVVRRLDGVNVLIEPGDAHTVSPLKAGDGVVFDASAWRSPQEQEEGGRVYTVTPRGRLLELGFGNGEIDPERIRPGDVVWRTDDPALGKALRRYTRATAPVEKQPVAVEVVAREGEPVVLRWSAGGHAVEVRSETPCPPAQARAFDEAAARAQLERLGDTAYELGPLRVEIVGRPFVPASLLNALRREAVARLEECQGTAPPRAVHRLDPAELQSGPAEPGTASAPALHLLVRASAQLDAAIAVRPDSITLDYLDLYGLKPSVERVRDAGIGVRVATPRVLKPGEEKIADFLRRLECPLLIRPAGLLEALAGVPLTGDFSLNAANTLTARQLLDLGLERLTPGHDLNAAQITALAQSTGGHRLEVIAYHHLPVFHTEHCVFCRFLSTGKDFRDCGRPCEHHQVELGDGNGRSHPVVADIGCRNTVFGAEAQEGSAFLADWLAAGVRHFRLEFVHETAVQVSGVARAWREALAGEISARELGERLRRLAPQGVTPGSFFVPLESVRPSGSPRTRTTG